MVDLGQRARPCLAGARTLSAPSVDKRSRALGARRHASCADLCAHAYVLAGSGKEDVWRAGRQWQVKTLLALLEEEDWCRVRAGDGTQGPRWYDGRWLPLAAPFIDGSPTASYTLRCPLQTKIDTAMAIIFLAMWIKESGFSPLSGLYSGFAPSVP